MALHGTERMGVAVKAENRHAVVASGMEGQEWHLIAGIGRNGGIGVERNGSEWQERPDAHGITVRCGEWQDMPVMDWNGGDGKGRICL